MKVTLLTGCNIGNKEKNMHLVIDIIEKEIGVVLKKSKIHASSPWGFSSQDEFLNQVIVCETELSPFKVLMKIWKIEKKFGKTRKSIKHEKNKLYLRQKGIIEYTSRKMDIDIIFYENINIITKLLTIPHPLYKEREFVTTPLKEVT